MQTCNDDCNSSLQILTLPYSEVCKELLSHLGTEHPWLQWGSTQTQKSPHWELTRLHHYKTKARSPYLPKQGLRCAKEQNKKPQQTQTGLQAVKLMKPCLCKMLFQCGKWNPKSYSIHQAGNGAGCHRWALGQPELPPDCCQTWQRRSSLLCLHKYTQIVSALT